MKLFDYIKILFGSDKDWNKLSYYDKIKNEFMIRRLMAIQYPIQSNLFNVMKTSSLGQAESWRLVTSKFNKVPVFIYTKTDKVNKKLKKLKIDDIVIKEYLKINEIGEREFNEALKMNFELVEKSLNTLSKVMNNGD